MDEGYALVMTACADQPGARAIIDALLEERLAACVQTLDIASHYVWKAEVCREPEVLLLIKTKGALFEDVARVIRRLHPYQVPEIIRLPITAGLPEYLSWIDDVCR